MLPKVIIFLSAPRRRKAPGLAIVFQVTCRHHPGRGHAEGYEPSGMLLRLRNYEVHRLKESLEEERETAVARKGPVGNAAVDYNDGYAPERGLPYKVGPYLRLYQDQYGKVRAPHEAPDGKRYVERQGEYVRRRAELTPEQVSRIVRVRGYYDGVIRFCPQEPDQVLRYDRLSHRGRVYPYGPLKRVADALAGKCARPDCAWSCASVRGAARRKAERQGRAGYISAGAYHPVRRLRKGDHRPLQVEALPLQGLSPGAPWHVDGVTPNVKDCRKRVREHEAVP